MKRLIVALAAIVIALSVPVWAGEKEYQECLRIQERGYAIGCLTPEELARLDVSTDVSKEQIEEKPTTYEVRLTVKYNAVNEAEAAEIARKALARHGEGACQLEVHIEKNGNDNTNGWVFSNPGNDLYTITGDSTTLEVK